MKETGEHQQGKTIYYGFGSQSFSSGQMVILYLDNSHADSLPTGAVGLNLGVRRYWRK